ncbi:MAG TPA: hypothetical protein VF885_00925 [Arthrobacter sp.]
MSTKAKPKRRTGLELVCIICSGGQYDLNGACTVCVLCTLEGLQPPTAGELLPAAAA